MFLEAPKIPENTIKYILKLDFFYLTLYLGQGLMKERLVNKGTCCKVIFIQNLVYLGLI